MSTDVPAKPLIFISYHRTDVEWSQRLIKHLSVYENVLAWSDIEIRPAQDWKNEIRSALNNASAGIFLVSADSLASEFIRNEEIAVLLQRRVQEGIPLIPVIASPCGWQSVEWLSRIQCRDQATLLEMDRAGAERELTEIARIVVESIGIDVRPGERADSRDVPAPLPMLPPTTRDRAIEGRAAQEYLDSFIQSVEPPFRFREDLCVIDASRSYRLLLHMFAHQTFDSFIALDIAFSRWIELVDPGSTQNVNVAHRIFDVLEDLFRDRRCPEFRRILVASKADLDQPGGHEVLQSIRDREGEWRQAYDVNVRTNVFIYPPRGSEYRHNRMVRLIGECCDFVLFNRGEDSLASIEQGLRGAHEVADLNVARHTLSIDGKQIARLKSAYEEIWSDSTSIDAYLEHAGDPSGNVEGEA